MMTVPVTKPRPAEIEFAREWIRQFFGGRCIRCQKETRIVHELEPRSQRPADYWEISNQVLLCAECHTWAHDTPSIVVLPILLRCQRAAMEGRTFEDTVV